MYKDRLNTQIERFNSITGLRNSALARDPNADTATFDEALDQIKEENPKIETIVQAVNKARIKARKEIHAENARRKRP